MKFTFILICLFPLLGLAQKDTIISFSNVVTVDSASKNQLFNNARQWFNKTFASSKDVLQIVDKETGELSGKGILKSYYDYKLLGSEKSYECYYRFSIDIKVKDNRFKYTFSNFIIEESLSQGLGDMPVMTSSDKCPKSYPLVSQKKVDAMYKSMKNYLVLSVNDLAQSLILEMKKKSDDDF